MKSIFSRSVVSLAALSLAGIATADSGHQHGPVQDKHAKHAHEEHASALGKPGDPAKITRTIRVDMYDTMRFSPQRISVKKGETIKFIVKNDGRIKHEMVLGSVRELKEHAEMMRKMPEMVHADENMVSVDPGETGEMVWQFTRAGAFDFACLQPGHFEAGMKGKIIVTKG